MHVNMALAQKLVLPQPPGCFSRSASCGSSNFRRAGGRAWAAFRVIWVADSGYPQLGLDLDLKPCLQEPTPSKPPNQSMGGEIRGKLIICPRPRKPQRPPKETPNQERHESWATGSLHRKSPDSFDMDTASMCCFFLAGGGGGGSGYLFLFLNRATLVKLLMWAVVVARSGCFCSGSQNGHRPPPLPHQSECTVAPTRSRAVYFLYSCKFTPEEDTSPGGPSKDSIAEWMAQKKSKLCIYH